MCVFAAASAAAPVAEARSGNRHAAKSHKAVARPKAKAVAAAATEPAAADSLPVSSSPPPPPKLLSRPEVLASDGDRLARVGRHIIVGFHDWEEVAALVAKRAIGGIFITDHNVRRKSAADIKDKIEALQEVRRQQGQPPLIVAADQEGGNVSRLSPPLKHQATLGHMLEHVEHDDDRRPIVEAYAREQAAELSRIGVTMNFGPVVDLKLDLKNRDDGETRLRQRAISADPYTVAKVAGWYCAGLAERNIMCTLKHFPGLGRVARDTHVVSGEVATSEGTLELNDWVPFRRLSRQPNVATMIGHVRLNAIDKTTPASFSRVIIGSLLRQNWEYEGLIVTDDFSMGAVTKNKMGIGRAAVESINAGADFVLVSYIEKHLDEILSALIAADAAGDLDTTAEQTSAQRIERIVTGAASGAKQP